MNPPTDWGKSSNSRLQVTMTQKHYYIEASLFVISLALFSIVWDIVAFYIAPIFSLPQTTTFPTTLILQPKNFPPFDLFFLLLYLVIQTLLVLSLSRLISWFYSNSRKKKLRLSDWLALGFILSLNQFQDLLGVFPMGIITMLFIGLYFVIFKRFTGD